MCVFLIMTTKKSAVKKKKHTEEHFKKHIDSGLCHRSKVADGKPQCWVFNFTREVVNETASGLALAGR